jgi:hypothetical protein
MIIMLRLAFRHLENIKRLWGYTDNKYAFRFASVSGEIGKMAAPEGLPSPRLASATGEAT